MLFREKIKDGVECCRMDFAKPLLFKAKLAEKYYLNEGQRFMFLRFELEEPSRIQFLAGQYLNVRVSEAGERRSFSFASTPDVDHAVSIAAEIIPGGKASEMFAKLEPGSEVEVLAPLGRFVVGETSAAKMLFVATGSGIVPLYSMINDLLRNRRETRPIRLHWGLRYEKDIFWLDNLERLREEYPNFTFDLVLSRPEEGWKLCYGHVQDCIKRDLPDLSDWEAYVSGNKNVIADVKDTLLKLGLPETRFYQEKFN